MKTIQAFIHQYEVLREKKSPIQAGIQSVKCIILLHRLRRGLIQFQYTKKDGTLRTATGTRSVDLMPYDDAPKGTGKTSSTTINYFDMDAMAWRSFQPWQLN